MQALFDHLAAVVIGATVLLIIAFTQFRGQEAAVEGVQYYAAKLQMVNFVRQLQTDLNGMGAGVSNAQIEAGAALQAYLVSGDTTNVFAFRTYADSASFAAKTTTDVVCYAREPTGDTVYVLDPATAAYVPKEAFQVIRRLNPTSAGSCSGGTVTAASMSSLTAFHIELRKDDGTTTSTFSEVRQLAVHVRAVSPLGGGRTAHLGGMRQHVDETRWDTVLRPRNLARYTL